MTYISAILREQVKQRARGYCEYCQAWSRAILFMEIEHITPDSAGGTTQLDNLAYACRGCNNLKKAFQTGFDVETDSEVVLYNPRQQNWHEHFQWDTTGTVLIGLTPTGRATIMRLKMNRTEVVEARELWVAAGWHPPSGL